MSFRGLANETAIPFWLNLVLIDLSGTRREC
jgi:hypothetical protein